MSGRVVVLRGDAAHLPLPDGSIHAVVCDPPYALAELPVAKVAEALSAWLEGDRGYVPKTGAGGFMGRKWDDFVPPPAAWDECMRVLKPDGYLLAFAAPRTQDLMCMSIRLAGFEIRDGMKWIFGQGMPKGKACLKPSHEPIIMARKPARRVAPLPGLEACRVDGGSRPARSNEVSASGLTGTGGAATYGSFAVRGSIAVGETTVGRWPPNVVFSHGPHCVPAGTRTIRGDSRIGGTGRRPGGFANIGADAGDSEPNGRLYGDAEVEAWDCAADCPVAELDAQSGMLTSGANPSQRHSDKFRDAYGDFAGQAECVAHRGADSGGASRFFPVFRYEAKADASERPRLPDGTAWPTVKPVALMRWLVRLVTPPGGTVGDFFCGTGPTGEAAIIEGFDAILLDKDPQAIALTRVRLAKPIQPLMFAPEPVAGPARPKPAASAQDSLFDLGEAS